MNLQSAREKLGQKLTNVSEVAAGVLRGIRRHNDSDVAAYVFDLNNRVPDTVGDLSSYLDEVMGPAYFDNNAPSDLRWNNYLYFVVDEDKARNQAFQSVKRNVESDRSYARKFVINEGNFDRVLEELDSVAVVDKSASAKDVVQAWSEGLSAVGYEDILDGERPIADVVRSISSGTAKQSTRTKKVTGVESSQQLVESHLASLDLTGFRSYPKKKSFESFGKANLLFGSNGVGKTSLLEGLEFLFCGANRRSGASTAASVEAVLATGHRIKTYGLQPISDFKTRQRLWYGSDDNSRQNKLTNPFARFNFLNTDAAAEMSLFKEGSKENNAESLAALLSGHEATLMWRRIQEVRKAVHEETRSKRSERAVASTDKAGKEKELSALEGVPSQADAAFAVFAKSLEQIGWRHAPTTKDEVTDQLIETLTSLTSQLGAIQQLSWLVGQVTESSIAQQELALRTASEGMTNDLPAIGEDERLAGALVQRHSVVKSRLAALEAIPLKAVADLLKLSTSLKQAKDDLIQYAKAYAALPSSPEPENWQTTLGHKVLSTACADAKANAQETGSQLDKLQKHLDATARTQSNLQEAMSELKSWAEKVVEHRHSDSNCPVCGTSFGPGELMRRMEALALVPSNTAISELRQSIKVLTLRQQRLAIESTWLGQLDKFARSLSDGEAPLTVRDTHLAASQAIERKQTLLDIVENTQKGLDAYAQSGLSLTAIAQLCTPIDGSGRQEPASLDVVGAINGAKLHLAQLENAREKLDARVFQRSQKLKLLLEEAGVQDTGSLEADIRQLKIRQRVAKQANEACTAAHGNLDFAPDADMRSLLTSLESSILDGQRVQAAMQADNNSVTRLTTARAQLAKLTERLNRISASIERLAEAQRVLDDIIENQSLDAASAAVVAATHKVADSIFGRIHAPAEFLVSAEPETPLRRRDNNAPVQLNQVSTGQRSAYALSMFLAMNAQVKAGPKVILLDDPISHIDDLNALSFLDYLRNLVIKSDRQVFFATADEKIAGLFVHKFGFLGEGFRTIELVRG